MSKIAIAITAVVCLFVGGMFMLYASQEVEQREEFGEWCVENGGERVNTTVLATSDGDRTNVTASCEIGNGTVGFEVWSLNNTSNEVFG